MGGAEVRGVDLRRQVTTIVARNLRQACLQYGFLMFRDQQINFEEQFRFGEVFGHVLEKRSDPLSPPRRPITDRPPRLTSELLLHFDHWLIAGWPKPVLFTTLYAVEVTPEGGETVFANAKASYNRLPPELKTRIDTLQALHCYDYSDTAGERLGTRVRESLLPPGQPSATHPLVLIHPTTGERILYLSPGNTDRILGLNEEESEVLFRELRRYVDEPANLYAHKWSAGDLLIWDNYSLLHGRKPFDARYPRHLRRLSIL
jgi:taurine dioxygenase